MVFLNYTTMQATTKIVYYGPGLCGKTTNLQWIHNRTAAGSRGEMVSLETEGDRTIFFDLLPLDVGMIGGMKVRLQLYTVPGQVFYNATRRLVLKGVDGIVFVADSQVPAMDANAESLDNLRQNLEELGLDPAQVPVAFQYNKRDLAQILPVPMLREALNPDGVPDFEAAAIHGVGVFETLKGISRQTLDCVRAKLAQDKRRAGVRRKKSATTTPAPKTPRSQPPAPDPSLLEPLEIEFAEEADDSGIRAVRTQDSDDIGRALGRLREVAAETERSSPRLVPEGDVEVLFQNLMGGDGRAEQEFERSAVVDVPAHLLRDLSDLRLHVGLDRGGREEILRDAIRVTLARARRIDRLRLKIELELKPK